MPELNSSPVGTFHKFVEFSRLVEKKDEKPTVYGIATWERPDSDDEIADYDSAVTAYQIWSKKALQRTKGAGQEISLGNIRIMHGAEVGGKVTSIDFRDDAKEIAVGSEPVDDDVYKQLKGGFLTGYSQGGSYAWRECEICKSAMPLSQGANFCNDCGKMVTVRYGLKRLAEISYVDSPAIGEGFEHVKAGGSCEIIKFQKHKENPVANKTKRYRGEELPSTSYAYVGDPENPDTWLLPIKLSTAEKTVGIVKRALRKMSTLAGVPAEKHVETKVKIQAAAKAAGIDDAAEGAALAKRLESARTLLKAGIDKAAEAKGFQKGLYAVGRFADILESLAYLYESSVYEREIEGDESEVPDELRDQLSGLIETFIAMAEEEARELAANRNTNKGATNAMTPEELEIQKKASEAAKRSMMSHFAKAASHHEKMADKHEALADEHEAAAAHHETMAEGSECKCGKAAKVAGAEKSDVSETPEHDAIHEVLDNQVTFHKSMAKCEMAKAKTHDGIAAMHDKFAEHNKKMAEAADESADKAESAAVLKAANAEADPTPAEPAKAAVPTMDGDVAKAAEALRGTPEYKTSIAEIAKAQVEAEVAALRTKTLAPLGIEIVDGKTAKGTNTPGTVRAVQRGGEAEEFEFATTSSKSNTGGL